MSKISVDWKEKTLTDLGQIGKAAAKCKTRDEARAFKKAYKAADEANYVANLKTLFHKMEEAECSRLMHLFGFSDKAAAEVLDGGSVAAEAGKETPKVRQQEGGKKALAPKPAKETAAAPAAPAGPKKPAKPAKAEEAEEGGTACSVCGEKFNGDEEGFTEDEHGIDACEDCVDTATETVEKGLTPKELKKGVPTDKVVEELKSKVKKSSKKDGKKPAKARKCEECGEDYVPDENSYTAEEEGVDACPSCVAQSVKDLAAQEAKDAKAKKKDAKPGKETPKVRKSEKTPKAKKDDDGGFDLEELTETYKGQRIKVLDDAKGVKGQKGVVRKVSSKTGNLIVKFADGTEVKGIHPDAVKILGAKKTEEAPAEKPAREGRKVKKERGSRSKGEGGGISIEISQAAMDKIVKGSIRAAKRFLKTAKIKRGVKPEAVFAEVAIETAKEKAAAMVQKAFVKQAGRFYADAVAEEKSAIRRAAREE